MNIQKYLIPLFLSYTGALIYKIIYNNNQIDQFNNNILNRYRLNIDDIYNNYLIKYGALLGFEVGLYLVTEIKYSIIEINPNFS